MTYLKYFSFCCGKSKVPGMGRKMHKLIFCLSALIICCAYTPHQVFYWDLPPYIWKENDTVKGSFKQNFKMFERFCDNHKSEFYHVKGGYKGFMEALYRQTYVETDKGNLSINVNDTWIPFINSSEQSTPFNSVVTYFTSKEMVVIVPRYKIEIMYKISLGLLRSVNFVVLCLILAFLAGIVVWFLVS